jgi:hypothetical protein
MTSPCRRTAWANHSFASSSCPKEWCAIAIRKCAQ